MKNYIFTFNLSLLLFTTSCAQLPTSRNDISKKSEIHLSKQLSPFISDGCSKWPDGTISKPEAWLKCCFVHDQHYWLGGTEAQRFHADQQLKACVKEEFTDWMSIVMYLGVRIGGGPQYQTSYRWGYGWNYDRGYIPLTQEEIDYDKTVAPKEFDDIRKYLKQKN